MTMAANKEDAGSRSIFHDVSMKNISLKMYLKITFL